MDNQFLIVRSPHQFQEDTVDVYQGKVIDWDGQIAEKRALFKPWNNDAIKTFDGDVQRCKIQEIEPFMEHVSLKNAEIKESTCQNEFSAQIGKIQMGIGENQFEKVVLSRVKWIDKGDEKSELELDEKSIFEVFQKACKKYEKSFVYLISTTDFGTWLGATPEILVELNHASMRTMSLAGTLFDENEVWTDKEKQEQSITSKHVSETLSALGLIENISELAEINHGTVRHLVQFHMADITNVEIEKLVSNLHPTPAVAGYPIVESVEFIKQMETHERELYTGIIGTTEEVYVNLRCAQIFSNGIKLYAGCGINSQSIAEREWKETELKMKVIGDLFFI